MARIQLTLPAPAELNGDGLTAELARAGVDDARVMLVDDQVRLDVPSSVSRAQVTAVVAAHTGEPPPATPEQLARRADDEFVAEMSAKVRAKTELDLAERDRLVVLLLERLSDSPLVP